MPWRKVFDNSGVPMGVAAGQDEAAFDKTIGTRLHEIINQRLDRFGKVQSVSILKSDVAGSTNKYIVIGLIDGLGMQLVRILDTTNFPQSTKVTELGSYVEIATTSATSIPKPSSRPAPVRGPGYVWSVTERVLTHSRGASP
jgi:hypothetical protein